MAIERPYDLSTPKNLIDSGSLLPSPVTGFPDIERFPDTLGYPAIFGASEDVRAYYERYLRSKYPTWADDVIAANIERAMNIPEVKENIEGMFELEKKIRETNPNWTGGWLGNEPSDRKPPPKE